MNADAKSIPFKSYTAEIILNGNRLIHVKDRGAGYHIIKHSNDKIQEKERPVMQNGSHEKILSVP